MRRTLLLLPRGFALGLPRGFLRRRLGLRFGSLRHTALLAIRDGDFRNSAVANRHALRSDYYSTMRKTATPLNESWMRSSGCGLPLRGPTRHTLLAKMLRIGRRARTFLDNANMRKPLRHRDFCDLRFSPVERIAPRNSSMTRLKQNLSRG